MSEKETRDKKDAVMQLFSLLLPNYQVIFTPRSIMLKNGDINSLIDENNFDNF